RATAADTARMRAGRTMDLSPEGAAQTGITGHAARETEARDFEPAIAGPWSRNPREQKKFSRSPTIGSRAAGELRQGRPQLAQLRRLVEDAIDMRRDLILRREPLAPPGQQDHRRAGRGRLDGGGDPPAVDVRHAEISDDELERLVAAARRLEGVDPRLPAIGRGHAVTIPAQRLAQRLDDERIVVHDEDAQRSNHQAECELLLRLFRRAGRNGEHDPYRRALARGAVDLEL